VHILDGVPQTLVHGAEEGATKLAEAVEIAGARVSKGAGHASGRANELSGHLRGQLKGQANELSGQLKGQAGELSGQLKGQAHDLSGQLKSRRARESAVHSLSRSLTKRRAQLMPSSDAMLKAQLVKTSRELAHESSDLGAAVDSLNQIIKSNRKAAARGRTRMFGGLALGAALMYHLDAAHGRERRAATARLLTGMIRGEGGTPPGAV
jgi:uncharacterized protein YjbJ (UPF0337 family)